jgi:hypothetical protein
MAEPLGILSTTVKVEGEAGAARANAEEAKVNCVLLDLLWTVAFVFPMSTAVSSKLRSQSMLFALL